LERKVEGNMSAMNQRRVEHDIDFISEHFNDPSWSVTGREPANHTSRGRRALVNIDVLVGVEQEGTESQLNRFV